MSRSRIISVIKEDNNFQRADVIKRNREKRTRNGQFLIEGVAQIRIASQHGWIFDALLYDPARKLSSWATDLLAAHPAADRWETAGPLLEKLSEKDETSELLAIVRMKQLTMGDVPKKDRGLVVVFDRPASPGNLGSSIRSADAFGADAVIVTGHAVDIFDPHVVRGSMGAIFAMPVVTLPSQQPLIEWIGAAQAEGLPYRVVGSSGKATSLVTSCDLTGPLVLVMGNETVGMSRGYWDICDDVVKIPIGGALSSLNVSCAASILLYEACRQRAAVTDHEPSLNSRA